MRPEHLTAEQPDFCFVYLGVVDIAGHNHGWMSAEYIEQIGIADRAIGILLRQLETANLLDRYFILVQSDHGGHDKTHGTDMPEDLTIPWIAAGAKVAQRGEIQGAVRIFDTGADAGSRARSAVAQGLGRSADHADLLSSTVTPWHGRR